MGQQASRASSNSLIKDLESLKIRKLKDKYKVETEINHGTFGRVYKAKRKSDGKLVAAKCIPLKFEGVNPEYYK